MLLIYHARTPNAAVRWIHTKVRVRAYEYLIECGIGVWLGETCTQPQPAGVFECFDPKFKCRAFYGVRVRTFDAAITRGSYCVAKETQPSLRLLHGADHARTG